MQDPGFHVTPDVPFLAVFPGVFFESALHGIGISKIPQKEETKANICWILSPVFLLFVLRKSQASEEHSDNSQTFCF